MDALIVLLGLFIGGSLFLLFMGKITAIVYNLKSVFFTFFIFWGIGIVLAWIAWKLALIIGIIALVLFIISKIISPKKKTKNAEEAENETASEAKTTNE